MSVAAVVMLLGILSWTFNRDGLLDPEEAVGHHVMNPPPDVRALGSADPILDFLTQHLKHEVRVPQFEHARSQVRLVGVRLDRLSNREAAFLMYDQRGARISLFAIPCGRRVTNMQDFRARSVDGRQVFVGQHRGYSMVAWGQEGVLYSMVSNVDEEELVRLVSMAR